MMNFCHLNCNCSEVYDKCDGFIINTTEKWKQKE